MTYRCTTCWYGTENPDKDPNILRDHGYYWHRKCAHVFAGREVLVPSPGKMLPKTDHDEGGRR